MNVYAFIYTAHSVLYQFSIEESKIFSHANVNCIECLAKGMYATNKTTPLLRVSSCVSLAYFVHASSQLE